MLFYFILFFLGWVFLEFCFVLLVHWPLRNQPGKIFPLPSPQNLEIFKKRGRREVSSPSLIFLPLPFLGCSSQKESTRPLHHGIEPVVCFAFSFKLFHVANLAIISCCLNYICSLWSNISRPEQTADRVKILFSVFLLSLCSLHYACKLA